MRLLICASTIDANHTNLGFFSEWVRAFARTAGGVVAIVQARGIDSMPNEVEIYSTGKEHGAGILFRFFKFIRLVSREMGRCDAVFVHMSPIYVLLVWPFAVFSGKPVYLWYVHKNVDLVLRIAHLLCDRVFSVSPASFRLKSRKVLFVGHGIDTSLFVPSAEQLASALICTIRSIGRISRAKRLMDLIEAGELLISKAPSDWRMEIVGSPVDRDGELYLGELQRRLAASPAKDHVHIRPGIPHRDMPAVYQTTHIFVNLSDTGSVDKAVLEAMSTGCSVITSNEAFLDMLPHESLIRELSPQRVMEAILRVWYESRPREDLRAVVAAHHSLDRLITRIVNEIRINVSH